jgi:orsellinic acid C2-O-methyltransferase
MNESGTSHRSEESNATRLMGMVSGFRMTQCLYVAVRLSIPDLLASGPRTSDDLAQAAGAHPPSLHRLLRALTTLEVVREREDGSFELLPMGELLRSDSPTSLRTWTLYNGQYLWQTWGRLLESVQTGESARSRLFGTEGFEHLERDPELAALFNQAMVEITRFISSAVVQAYDFSDFRCIVDVGGGYGELLGAILKANPQARGILFDMDHAIDEGGRHLKAAGVADRCEFVSGSFFESVPAGADAYVLKSIIHDWNDERARVILTTCRRAMPEQATLLLVERVMPERLGTTPSDQAMAQSDLNMLIQLAAQERTESEFVALLESTDFRHTRTVPAGRGFSVLEAVPI